MSSEDVTEVAQATAPPGQEAVSPSSHLAEQTNSETNHPQEVEDESTGEAADEKESSESPAQEHDPRPQQHQAEVVDIQLEDGQTPRASVDNEDDDGDISLATSPRSKNDAASFPSSHRRIDSVPPQKYEVAHDASAGVTASLASTSLHSTIEEEELDLSLPDHDDSLRSELSPTTPTPFHSFGQHFSPSQQEIDSENHFATSEIDKADLNFVDITLDAPAEDVSSDGTRLEPSNPLAGSIRTAEQIRSDSVSSHNLPKKGPSAATPSQEGTASAPNTMSSSQELSPPHSPDHGESLTAEDINNRKSVEGRYRGRRSAASSRAASPSRTPSPSPSRRASFVQSHDHGSVLPTTSTSSQTGLSVTAAPVLLAADEHGNISVVSDVPVSPRTMTHSLPEGEAPAAAPNSQSAEGQHSKTATEQPRLSVQSGRAAASISDEVQAADAAESSNATASEHSQRAEPSLSVPSINGEAADAKASPGLSDKADQVDGKARRKSSFASNASNDPVESRTRMTTLPAKPKTEEIKHRADFERMMMAAKEVERKKREEGEERKRRRQDEQRQALARWEKEILPSWSRARKDPELGQLWWKGAPPSIRGRVWALAIGNPLMLPRNLLEQSEKKAAGSDNKTIEQIIPPRVLDQIDQDVEDTLPSLKLFQAHGPLHEDLVRICRAFVLVRMEQVAELDVAGDADKAASRHQNASPATPKVDLPSLPGDDSAPEQQEPEDEYARRGIDIYQPGLASLAGVLLINMSINTAFIALLNLFHSKPWLKALYSLLPTVLPPGVAATTAKPSLATATRKAGSAYTLPPKEKAIRGFERVLETLLADQMPKVYANLLARNVKLYRVVLRDWVSTLWTRWLDVDTVMRLWDVVLLDETDSMIYRMCLALVQTLESRLYVPDQAELESMLKGTNKAALAIWRREKEAAGELEVHAQRALMAPRHSRSSPTPQQTPEALPATPPTARSSSNASGPSATPPPRTSSLPHPTEETSSNEEANTSIAYEDIIPRDYIYEQYGIKEDQVFETLEAQESWWKQSTLQRLLDRELSE